MGGMLRLYVIFCVVMYHIVEDIVEYIMELHLLKTLCVSVIFDHYHPESYEVGAR